MKRVYLVRATFLFLIAFSVLYSIGAVQLKLGSPTSPGPGFVPFLLGLFIGGASIIGLISRFRAGNKDEQENEERVLSLRSLYRPIIMCVAVIVYALILKHLGFTLSIFLLMLFLFKGIESQRWITALLASVLTTALAYLLFIYGLGIQIV